MSRLFSTPVPLARIPRGLAVGLVAMLLAVGCSSVPQPSIEEQRQFDAAIATSASDPDEAARQLEAFLHAYKTSPLAEQAADLRAELALTVGDRKKAKFWLRWLIRNYPTGDRSDEARVELARLAFQEGDSETVAWALEDVRFDRLSPSQKRLSFRLLAEGESDPVDRLRWVSKARRAAVAAEVLPESLKLIDAELARLVDQLSAFELLRASDRLKGRPPAGRVALRMAALNMNAGDWDAAEEELEAAADLELGPNDQQLQADLVMRMEFHRAGHRESDLLPSFASVAKQPVPSVEGAIGTLAVVLPLSGPYATYGQSSLRGVLLAAGVFDEVPQFELGEQPVSLGEPLPSELRRSGMHAAIADGGASQPESEADARPEDELRILVYDTAGDPARAAQAVHASAADENVVAVVGPLRSSECEAAAAAAEEVGLPLLALSTRAEIARDRSFVFRLRTTPEDELRYLVDYAFDHKQARRFAILHPEDGYGRGMRDHFWRMVVERGGWVVAVSSYSPDATDFADPIREMIGYPLLTPGEHRALAEREAFLRRSRRLPPRDAQLAHAVAKGMIGPEATPLPPIVDFDALFIPDGYGNIGLLAPQLAFHEIEDVQLLGVGDWMHPDLIEIAREHVRGAVLSARFDPNARFAFVADLVDGYRAAFDEEPDVFAAQAYDAANLVFVQLAEGRETRAEVRDGILRMTAYPGASGVTSIAPDGNARKRPFLIEVTRSGFAPLD